jgi:hypothetical protein
MAETPNTDTVITATPAGDSIEAPAEKSWEEFESCTRCHGRAHIEETADGELYCQLCQAHLPRPSS